jgi:hypothetical protein
MSESWRAPGGWTVEIVQLSQTPDNHDGSWIRLRLNGFFVADVATVAELAEWIDVADLEPGGLTLLACRSTRRADGCSLVLLRAQRRDASHAATAASWPHTTIAQ